MYKCDICGKEFDNERQCSGHKSVHFRPHQYSNRQRKTESVCIYCGNRVNSKNASFCSKQCEINYKQLQWESKWFSGEINGFYETNHWGKTPDRIRKYLFRKYDNKCARCGWGEINSFTNRIPLEVEHIDGNYKNNRPENLILLCPNCHSLTETYRGANRGNGRKKTWKLTE